MYEQSVVVNGISEFIFKQIHFVRKQIFFILRIADYLKFKRFCGTYYLLRKWNGECCPDQRQAYQVGQHFWLSGKDFNYISNETVALSGAHISTETLLRTPGLVQARQHFAQFAAFISIHICRCGESKDGKMWQMERKESKKCSENKGGGQEKR